MNHNPTTARTLALKARLLLSGHPTQVQAAVLADLLATWLAGHNDTDAEGNTLALREALLDLHLEIARKLSVGLGDTP